MRVGRQYEQLIVLDAPGSSSLNTNSQGGVPREIIRIVGDVPFAPGSAALLPSSRPRLDQFVERLQSGSADDDVYIEIPEQADAIGADEQSRLVSHARAEVVRRYLCTRLGEPIERIGIVSGRSLARIANDRSAQGRKRTGRIIALVLR